jgi:hypothetical protein
MTIRRSANECFEQSGRLSNPVLRRLDVTAVDGLVMLYLQGFSTSQLATKLSIHRTTVIYHLQHREISRRRSERKLCDERVPAAAIRYAEGPSMTLVAAEFGVHERTPDRSRLVRYLLAL